MLYSKKVLSINPALLKRGENTSYDNIKIMIGPKGGVGKTDFVANVLYNVSLLTGSKGLGIDADPQRNLSLYFKEESSEYINNLINNNRNIYKLLDGDLPLEEIISTTQTRNSISKNFELIPSDVDVLSGLSKSLLTMTSASQEKFFKQLKSIKDYPLKIIDTPGQITKEMVQFMQNAQKLGIEFFFITDLSVASSRSMSTYIYDIAKAMGLNTLKKCKIHFIINGFGTYINPDKRNIVALRFLRQLPNKLNDLDTNKGGSGTLFTDNFFASAKASFITYAGNFHEYHDKAALYSKLNPHSKTTKDYEIVAKKIIESTPGFVHKDLIKSTLSRDVFKKGLWKVAFKAVISNEQQYLAWHPAKLLTKEKLMNLGGIELVQLWQMSHS